jgi:hypothetical protein
MKELGLELELELGLELRLGLGLVTLTKEDKYPAPTSFLYIFGLPAYNIRARVRVSV